MQNLILALGMTACVIGMSPAVAAERFHSRADTPALAIDDGPDLKRVDVWNRPSRSFELEPELKRAGASRPARSADDEVSLKGAGTARRPSRASNDEETVPTSAGSRARVGHDVEEAAPARSGLAWRTGGRTAEEFPERETVRAWNASPTRREAQVVAGGTAGRPARITASAGTSAAAARPGRTAD